MNQTQASCGHSVVAVGAPGSMARRAQERRHCGQPRCRSGLPKKFTDAECEAFCHMSDCRISFTVDLLDKSAMIHRGKHAGDYTSLIEAAEATSKV